MWNQQVIRSVEQLIVSEQICKLSKFSFYLLGFQFEKLVEDGSSFVNGFKVFQFGILVGL